MLYDFRLHNGLKQKWADGEYNYEVRIHEGNSDYTSSELIYRISRKRVPSSDPSVQGSGTEYLGADEIWYHLSTLKEFNGDGSPNLNFNEEAAIITHIPLN